MPAALMLAAALLSCAARQSAGAPPPSALAADAPKATASGVDAAGLYVSTRGDDSKDGSTPERALRSVSAALARARAGTTVFVAGGTYYEQVVTKAGGSEGAEITVKSYDGTAVIDGSRLDWAAGRNQNQGLVELRHPHVKLAGLKVVGSKNTGILLAADHLTVEGCEVSEARLHGVSTDTSRQTNYRGRRGTMIRDVVLRGNTVARSALSGSGQAISLIADGFAVTGNTVRDNPKEGIDIWLGAQHGEVAGNTVYGNNAPGIYIDGASYVRVHSNRVFNNAKGIGVTSEDANYSTHDIWVYDNVIYDNSNAGLFVWDDAAAPGFKGSQNVLLAHNTLSGNGLSVYLSGEGNTGEVMNNFGVSAGAGLYSSAVNSTFNNHHNVWLKAGGGFVDAAAKDFRLTSASPALEKGLVAPYFYDDLGNGYTVAADFDGLSRFSGAAPDAGAFEYR